MLRGQLRNGSAGKWPSACQQFLIHHRQRILIAVQARSAIEHFRRGVDWRQTSDDRTLDLPEFFEQPEICDLRATSDDQEISRLDVQMLQLVALMEVVERVGDVLHVFQQSVTWDTTGSPFTMLVVDIFQRSIGQLGDDDQLVFNPFESFERQQKRVLDALHSLE